MAENAKLLVTQLTMTKKYLDKTISCFDEADSDVKPKPEMFSVAQQVAHTAQTVDWFIEGALTKEKFNHDFPGMEKEVRKVTSLKAAREWLDRAFKNATDVIGGKGDEELAKPLADPSIMGPMPRGSVVNGILDHTAHHRGSLAVYARCAGKVAPMPYM